MEKPYASDVAVVMQRRAARKAAGPTRCWEPRGVLADPGGGGRGCCVDADGVEQWLHPGLQARAARDELEGYYMNVSAAEPRVFMLWRMDGRERARCRSRSP